MLCRNGTFVHFPPNPVSALNKSAYQCSDHRTPTPSLSVGPSCPTINNENGFGCSLELLLPMRLPRMDTCPKIYSHAARGVQNTSRCAHTFFLVAVKSSMNCIDGCGILLSPEPLFPSLIRDGHQVRDSKMGRPPASARACRCVGRRQGE